MNPQPSTLNRKTVKLSVVLAVRNEEENLPRCLEAVKAIANEIIVVDEHSMDRTREVAKEYGAKVYLEPHHPIFHITKQKALDYATGDWVLQLDADEVITPELAKEILMVVSNPQPQTLNPPTSKRRLFERHQKLLGYLVSDGEPVAYFIPRRNIFLGKPLIHAGAYPDGVIRLLKKGKARFPQKSVHEQMEVEGPVGWLSGDLLHYDSPTLKRYFNRMNRYTDLQAGELKSKKVGLSPFLFYVLFKPVSVFLDLYLRHKGFLDGPRGFLWSFFSAWHYPIAYFKYLTNNTVNK